MASAMTWIPSVLYAASLLAYLYWFRSGNRGGLATGLMLAAALLELVDLGWLAASRAGWPPASRGESFAMLALSTAAIYLPLERRTGDRGTGPLALALILPFALAGALLGRAPVVPPVLEGGTYALHANSFVVAFASFNVAALLSVAYLLQYHQLRSRNPGLWMQRLPSLQSLDRMARGATRVGFGFLTLGLVLGLVVAHRAWGEAWSWDPKQCATLLTWLLYLGVLVLRRVRGWAGGTVATANLVAFASIFVGVVLVYLLFETAHRFGGGAG